MGSMCRYEAIAMCLRMEPHTEPQVKCCGRGEAWCRASDHLPDGDCNVLHSSEKSRNKRTGQKGRLGRNVVLSSVTSFSCFRQSRMDGSREVVCDWSLRVYAIEKKKKRKRKIAQHILRRVSSSSMMQPDIRSVLLRCSGSFGSPRTWATRCLLGSQVAILPRCDLWK
ncbi:hypothetical protein BD289DRAFT_421027 [Coniella lustricola]|uniref:Uncharacterized protein n=1 Tax=Coniella lustricola TaxID=2025994 RepID=A0A2T3ALS8_9PEZI|nr:hypothetical protein BD289DRAFT_421027 [Coniella lustricola]